MKKYQKLFKKAATRYVFERICGQKNELNCHYTLSDASGNSPQTEYRSEGSYTGWVIGAHESWPLTNSFSDGTCSSSTSKGKAPGEGNWSFCGEGHNLDSIEYLQ